MAQVTVRELRTVIATLMEAGFELKMLNARCADDKLEPVEFDTIVDILAVMSMAGEACFELTQTLINSIPAKPIRGNLRVIK